MPRTLPAELTTAMNSGIFNPYLKIILIDSGGIEFETDPLYFKLEPTSATIKVTIDDFETADADSVTRFRVVRGAVINGTPSTITSSKYLIFTSIKSATEVTITGGIQQNDYMTVAANSTYDTVLTQILPNTISYEGTPAWKNYKFYPTGKTIVFSKGTRIHAIIKQKYLLFATEDGLDGSSNNNIFVFCATDSRATDYTIEDPLFTFNEGSEIRQLISRDENMTIRTAGPGNTTLHNLGYIESSASLPTWEENKYTGSKSSKLRVHLKYRTGDKVTITRNGNTIFTKRIKVTETFDPNSEPSWFHTIETLQWFDSTEGGAMPSTIEAAAPYTPLNTSEFGSVLTSNDNNLQAAMDTLDDHTHAYTALTGRPAAETNANDIFRCDSPGGTSAFVGTINGTPSGTSVVYNVTSGNEGAMVPTSTSQLAKMRLYNTTRSNSALISNCNTGTNTITLTATVPANWASGDTITIASQTVSGGSIDWVDLEITATITNKLYLFITLLVVSATVGNQVFAHPLETYGTSKLKRVTEFVANTVNEDTKLLKITSNVFAFGWSGTPTAAVARLDGYLE